MYPFIQVSKTGENVMDEEEAKREEEEESFNMSQIVKDDVEENSEAGSEEPQAGPSGLKTLNYTFQIKL